MPSLPTLLALGVGYAGQMIAVMSDWPGLDRFLADDPVGCGPTRRRHPPLQRAGAALAGGTTGDVTGSGCRPASRCRSTFTSPEAPDLDLPHLVAHPAPVAGTRPAPSTSSATTVRRCTLIGYRKTFCVSVLGVGTSS